MNRLHPPITQTVVFEKAYRGRYFWLALLVLLWALFGYVFILKNQRAALTQAEQQSHGLMQVLEQKQVQLGLQKQVNLAIRKLQQKNIKLRTLFAKKITLATVLNELSDRARLQGLLLQRIKPIPQSEQTIFNQHSIKLQVKGTYPAIAEFIYGLAQDETFYRLSEFSLAQAADSQQLLLEARIDSYFLPSSPSIAEADNVKGKNVKGKQPK